MEKETGSQEKSGLNLHKKMLITDEELSKERIPLASRDYCAHLLVSLNRCYRANFYLPFRCKKEKHEYEQCQYNDFIERVKLLNANEKKE